MKGMPCRPWTTSEIGREEGNYCNKNIHKQFMEKDRTPSDHNGWKTEVIDNWRYDLSSKNCKIVIM